MATSSNDPIQSFPATASSLPMSHEIARFRRGDVGVEGAVRADRARLVLAGKTLASRDQAPLLVGNSR